MNTILNKFQKFTKEDIKQAQERDFEADYDYFRDDIQRFIDLSKNVNGKLNGIQRAYLDILFCEIQLLLEDTKELIK